MAKIHPTAVIDPSANIHEDAEIGPFCVIESDVAIGAGTVVGSGSVIRQYTTIGENNQIDPHVVIGGLPQDYNFDGAVTHVKIGDNNIFREFVTINRATGEGNSTVVGNNTLWMTCAHAGHNAVIGDNVILVNGVALAGYAEVGNRANLSSNVAVHQFTWVGEGALCQGNSGTSCHVPPFCILGDGINTIVGLNKIGMQRNPEFNREDRLQVKEAFAILFRSGLTTPNALAKMEECTDWGLAATRFRDFVRKAVNAEKPYKRPIARFIKKRSER